MCKTIIPLFVLIVFSSFQNEDRLKFYWGETQIEYQSGLSLKKINQSRDVDQLHFIIREDLEAEVLKRNLRLEINLIRNGTSISSIRFDHVPSNYTLKIPRILSSLRTGDTILIQIKNAEGILPQIIGLRITY